MKMSRFVVIGGAGFIGSNFVSYLEKLGHEVTVLDKLTYAGINADKYKGETLVVDIADGVEGIDNLMPDKVEAVFNFAAESHVDNSINSAKEFVDSNVLGAYNVAMACKLINVPLIHISTDEVYGDTDFSSDYEFSVNDRLHPSNPYAATKASADLMLEALGRTHGVKYKIVRMTNNYGPWQHKEKFIPTVIRNILNGTAVPVYGRGANIREWLYVKDAAKGIFNIHQHGKDRKIYNLGDYKNRMTNMDMMNNIIGLMLLSNDPILFSMGQKAKFEFVSDRPGHDRRYALKSRETNDVFRKKDDIIVYTEINAGLSETVDYYFQEEGL